MQTPTVLSSRRRGLASRNERIVAHVLPACGRGSHRAVVRRHLPWVGLHDCKQLPTHALHAVQVAAVAEHAGEPPTSPPHQNDGLARAFDFSPPSATAALLLNAGASNGNALPLIQRND